MSDKQVERTGRQVFKYLFGEFRLSVYYLFDFYFFRPLDKPPQAAFLNRLPGFYRFREVLCAEYQYRRNIAQRTAFTSHRKAFLDYLFRVKIDFGQTRNSLRSKYECRRTCRGCLIFLAAYRYLNLLLEYGVGDLFFYCFRCHSLLR